MVDQPVIRFRALWWGVVCGAAAGDHALLAVRTAVMLLLLVMCVAGNFRAAVMCL